MTLSYEQRRAQFVQELKKDMERGYQDSIRNARELAQRRQEKERQNKRKKHWFSKTK